MLGSALTAMIASVTVNGTWAFVHVSPSFPEQSCHLGNGLLSWCSFLSLNVTEKSALIHPYLSAKQLIMSVSQPSKLAWFITADVVQDLSWHLPTNVFEFTKYAIDLCLIIITNIKGTVFID